MCPGPTKLSRIDCLVDRIVDRLIQKLFECEGPATLGIVLGPVSERSLPMPPDNSSPLILTDTQRITLSIAPKDRAGNPAEVETVTWGTSDPSVVSLTPAPDGLSCVASTAGPLGTVQVTVTADADLGTGVEELTGVQEIQVVAGKAVSLGITAGGVEERD